MTGNEKLGLGTVQFGMSYGISNQKGKTPKEEVHAILDLARKKGIQVLDSASAYGDAEKVLGENDLENFRIISKFTSLPAGETVYHQLQVTLQNLRVPAIYGYLAHRPLDLLSHPEQWDELQGLKSDGKINKIGFSLNEPEELELLLAKGYIPDLVQAPYNYLDKRFEGQLIDLKNKGYEIHTRSAFLQGLFFMPVEHLDSFFDDVKPQLIKLQKEPNLPGSLLKFVLEKPFIDKVIIGVESTDQLLANLEGIGNSPGLPDPGTFTSNEILIPSKWPKR